jgi:hypothetical protein
VLTAPLSNHTYGAASIYCFFNTLGPRSELFTYLCEDQNSVLTDFRKKHLITSTGKPLFSNKQLEDLTMLLPDNVGEAATTFTPCQLNPERNRDDDSSTILAVQQNGDPLPQTADNPNTQAPAGEETTQPIPPKMEHVIYKVKEVLYDIVPSLFLVLSNTVDASQAEKKADAKLEAALKQKKTLDMAKILETDLADQQVVAPETMEALVNSLVDQRISTKEKQTRKATLQALRKKSSGGAKAAKTPPGKHNNGGKPNGILKSNK